MWKVQQSDKWHQVFCKQAINRGLNMLFFFWFFWKSRELGFFFVLFFKNKFWFTEEMRTTSLYQLAYCLWKSPVKRWCQPARLVLHMDGGLLPEDRVLWRETVRNQQAESQTEMWFWLQWRFFFTHVKVNCQPNLLADWTILLAGYDGKVAADSPQAGEDLEGREDGELQVKESFERSFHCNAGGKLIIKMQMFWEMLLCKTQHGDTLRLIFHFALGNSGKLFFALLSKLAENASSLPFKWTTGAFLKTSCSGFRTGGAATRGITFQCCTTSSWQHQRSSMSRLSPKLQPQHWLSAQGEAHRVSGVQSRPWNPPDQL